MGRVTFRSFLKENDVKTLTARLERFEARLRLHVSDTLQEFVTQT